MLGPVTYTEATDIGNYVYAGNFCHKTYQSQPTSPCTSAIRKYAVYIRKISLRSKLPIKGKWPPSPCKKIIKLATVEQITQHQEAKLQRLESIDEYMLQNGMDQVSMDDLLQPIDGSPIKILVVQGVPGIGKSTFAWKFCRKWAKGKIYQQYDLVVLLRMRDTRVREATKLHDLFFSEDEEFPKQVAKDIISREGKSTLLIMEGLDELPASCLADGTLLSNLLQGLSLPEVTIMVTTRPWAVQMLTEKCGDQISRLVEILGFTKEDIQRYASHAFPVEAKTEFLEYLHSHPQLESIMHIPLNAAFVVQIYKQFKCSQQTVPHTLTQLYTALVKGLLLRYMKSVPEFCEQNLGDFKNLPEPIRTHFEQLCLLAFMSFTKLSVQVTFTDSEAALYGCLDSLGLMQSSADLSIDTGTTVTHSFLHFTIQEFLAAYHLSKQPAQVQELFIETHKNDDQFHMLLKFLIGLNCDVLEFLRESAPNTKLSTLQLYWLFESQSPMAVCNFLGNEIVDYKSVNATPLDLYALSYSLCCSNCKWNLFISVRNLTAIYSIDHNTFNGEIRTLIFSNTTQIGLNLFFSLPRHLIKTISYLKVFSDVDIDSAVAEVLINSSLQSLSIFSYNVCESSVSATLRSLCCYSSLIGFAFGWCSFTSSDMLLLCQYITSSCPSDFYVSLNSTTFKEDCLQTFISAVACSKFLSGFSLKHVKLSLTELEMLSIALSSNCMLNRIKLYDCSIDGEKAELLATGLEESKNLKEVDLTDNNIDANGATALGLMLEVNTSLKKLNLSKNGLIGNRGALRLICALEQNKTLEQLILPAECEPAEYESILFKRIRGENRVLFKD